MNKLIIGLAGDKKGLLVRVKSMDENSFWHVHSDEMTLYQQQIHKKMVERK